MTQTLNLQMGGERLREVRELAQGHRKWLSQRVSLESMLSVVPYMVQISVLHGNENPSMLAFLSESVSRRFLGVSGRRSQLSV